MRHCLKSIHHKPTCSRYKTVSTKGAQSLQQQKQEVSHYAKRFSRRVYTLNRTVDKFRLSPPPGISNDGIPNLGIPKTAILGTPQFGTPGFSCGIPTGSVVCYTSCSRSKAPTCLITVVVGNPLHFLSSWQRGCDGVWSCEEILTDNVHGCFVRNVSSYHGLSKKLLHARFFGR